MISIQEIVLSEEFIRRERQNRVKRIKTIKVYERYFVDTVKLSQDLNMNVKYKLFLSE